MSQNREPGNPRIFDLFTKRDGSPSALRQRIEAGGKRPDDYSRWEVRWTDYNGKTKTKTFRRKVDARNFSDEITAQFRRAEYVDPSEGRVTVRELHSEAAALAIHVSEKTRYERELIWRNHVAERFGNVRAQDVRKTDVQAWIADMHEAGAGHSTKAQSLQVLRQAFSYAVDAGHLRSNPANGVKLPKEPERDRHYLNVRQVEALADAVEPPHALLIRVLAYCGPRWGEVTALRVRDVDLERRRLHVKRAYSVVKGKHVLKTPKTHETRSIPFPGYLLDDLTSATQDRDADSLLFPSSRGGPLSPSNFRVRVLKPALAKAEQEIGETMPPVTIHDLRHTAASLAVSAGANVKGVQLMLGHASAAMTLDRYSDLFDDDLDLVAAKMDELIRHRA